jgi:hypothetical protein
MEPDKENECGISSAKGSTHFQQFALQARDTAASKTAVVTSGVRGRLATAIQRSNAHVRPRQQILFCS